MPPTDRSGSRFVDYRCGREGLPLLNPILAIFEVDARAGCRPQATVIVKSTVFKLAPERDRGNDVPPRVSMRPHFLSNHSSDGCFFGVAVFVIIAQFGPLGTTYGPTRVVGADTTHD